MSNDYDVVIVGGGPAGSTLAWALQRQSRKKVLIMDKQTFPRDKICAGWVTPAVVESLALDLEDYRRERELQPIHRFSIGMMGQQAVENDHGAAPISYGIRRCEFDHYLLQRCNAELALGQKLKSLEREGDNWLINGEIRTPLVVGAGGHFCPVANRLGQGPGSHELAVTAKEIEFRMDDAQSAHCQVRGDTPELWFCDDLKGYAWVFRKGNYLNIGLGREDNHRLGDHLEAFVQRMQADGRIPTDLPGRFKGHAYLLYNHAQRPLIDDGLLLIGDAAGLAYTQSGEGIRPAVESALLAAQVIDTLGDTKRASLQPYADAIEERFGERPGASLEAGGLKLPEWAKLKIASRLMQSHWFTRHVVTNRWFLHQELRPLASPEPVAAASVT
jgi:flavin-dependent dehydrogenase